MISLRLQRLQYRPAPMQFQVDDAIDPIPSIVLRCSEKSRWARGCRTRTGTGRFRFFANFDRQYYTGISLGVVALCGGADRPRVACSGTESRSEFRTTACRTVSCPHPPAQSADEPSPSMLPLYCPAPTLHLIRMTFSARVRWRERQSSRVPPQQSSSPSMRSAAGRRYSAGRAVVGLGHRSDRMCSRTASRRTRKRSLLL